MTYIPPFKITPLILKLSQSIMHELGLLSGLKIDQPDIYLRRSNTIKTIQASLSIEGNSLDLEQVTQLFSGKRVIGAAKDIIEVNNAIEVYKNLSSLDALSINDFLKVHKKLLKDLDDQSGQWRKGGVGIFKGEEVVHVAPPAPRVPSLMESLFQFLAKNKDLPWLLKACIFHYELEFIHPFADGNGRTGRLWQQLILMKEDPIFEFIPIEVLIKENQTRYYQVLGECDKAGDSTQFIEFSLEQILLAIKKYNQSTKPKVGDFESRLLYAQGKITQTWFSRKDYLTIHKDISMATASRDLHQGIKEGILKKKGEKNQVRYSFI